MSQVGSDVEEEEVATPSSPEVRVSLERYLMAKIKLGGPKFDVEGYDGRSDYLLWERQVKSVLRAMGLGKILKPKPSGVDTDEWDDIQEQAVSLVALYLKPAVFKQVEMEADVNKMFETLRQKYHHYVPKTDSIPPYGP